MAIGLCRFCLEERPLIEAHIIPKGFFERIRTDEANILINESDYPKRSPQGIYDKGILCGPCDNIIGKWDQYAQEALPAEMSAFTLIADRQIIGGWERPDYDYELLKLFFISLVWRASISTHPFYVGISIGSKFEEEARLMLREGRPGGAHDFGVVIARFVEPVGQAFFDPHTERMNGINHVRFYLAGFIAYMKVDQRPYDPGLAHFLLAEGHPLRIIKRSIHQGGEAEVLSKVFNASKNKRRRGQPTAL
ncbi:MAG TPA: hypothetical protein VK789_07260 [Bryobacteraceae bacterium]|nr:hypothetical protein [Bryobacteraceae bacterium]